MMKRTKSFFAICLLSFFLFVIYANFNSTLNQIDPLSDLGNYENFYYASSGAPLPEIRFEIGFSIFTWVLSKIINLKTYLAMPSFLLWLGLFAVIRLNVKNIYIAAALSFLLTLFYPPYVSLTNVVLRQGVASACAIYFLIQIYEKFKMKWRAIFIYLIIFSFHASGSIFIFASIFSKWVNIKIIFWLWMALSIGYVFNYSGEIGIFMLDIMRIDLNVLNAFDRNDIDYEVGFKFNYFVLSSMPVIFIVLIRLLKTSHLRTYSEFEKYAFKVFLVINSVAMMFSLSTFSDRMFTWSWILVPIILIRIVNSITVLKYEVRKR